MIAAQKEANRMLILDAVIVAGSVNARLVMKMLMVKPMPTRKETPNR